MRALLKIALVFALSIFPVSTLMAQAPTSSGSTIPPGAIPVSLFELGEKYIFPEIEIKFEYAIPGGIDGAITGKEFTEYRYTFKNPSPNKKLLISKIAFKIGTDLRSKVNDRAELLAMQKSLSTMSDNEAAALGVGVTAASTAAVSIADAMIPMGGSIVYGLLEGAKPFIGVKLAQDDEAWWKESKRRTFQNETAAGISIFPEESITGSDWVRQTRGEIVEEVHFYLEIGGDAKLIKIKPKQPK